MKEHSLRTGAFTIVELIVVIAIIALLTGIVVSNLAGSKSKARDAQRVSDLAKIQNALGIYHDRCDQYPGIASGGGVDPNASCTTSNGSTVKFTDFLSLIPMPPVAASQPGYYGYAVNNILGLNVDYVLHASMESSNNAQGSSLTDAKKPSFVGNLFNCYDASGFPYDYCVTSK